MERLTIRTPSGAALKMRERYPSEDAARNDLMAKYKIAMERLADYEDTELSPQTLSEVLDGVSDWYDAHKEERLLVLPCKIGDTVYWLREPAILPVYIEWFVANADGWCACGKYPPMSILAFKFDDFGKTVFLTREEAEAALKKEEPNGG